MDEPSLIAYIRRWMCRLVAIALVAIAGCQSRRAPPAVSLDGAELYARACASCHGTAGRGDTVQGRALGAKDLTRAEVRGRSDAELAHQIRVGRARMPAFGLLLSDGEIDAVVAHTRRLSAAEPGRVEITDRDSGVEHRRRF